MANPTTNFGWVMPTSTDLVTDLPADFAVFGQGVDTTMADLKGGTTGQILAKATNTDMDFVWVANDQGDITAVNVTAPITGGGTSGAVTIGVSAASTAASGVVQLSDSTSTTSSVLAATPTAVKAAYDLAAAAVTLTGTQTLSNKTLTAAIENNPVLKSPEERCTVSATAATGTVAFDTQTQGVLYYTTNASANFTLNFTNVNANLAVGDSIGCVFLNTNGATAYYPTAFQIDSVAVTPKWSGGTAPSAGNASAIDSYSFIIIKTAATPTYTVLAGGAVKFA